MSRWWTASGWILAVACDGGTTTPTIGGCETGAAPALEIGVGLEGYEPLGEMGHFPLIHGPQGGFHLEIGLRATHLDTSDLALGHMVGTIDGTVYADSEPWIDFRCQNDVDAQEAYGMLLIYDSTPDFLDGKTTEVSVDVTDIAGNTVSATRTFVIEDTL
ncbi:MAG: hypothetical protein KC621_20025 [Myxococcales bacterium]|nr:hypothetical protein [Myxococcales bacterium]